MTFLLTAINAKYIHSNPAIYSLLSYAGEENKPYISLAEYTINENIEDILDGIYRQHPTAIGISCYIWNMNYVETLLRELPKILPHTDIWLGGPEVSYDAAHWLQKYPDLAGVMVGEGEATFKELLEVYIEKEELDHRKPIEEELKHIPGLCLSFGYTRTREALDLSAIPFLYQDMKPFENRIIYYETSRGCPYNCSYCLSSIDKKVRLRSIDLVEKELQFFLDQRVPQVKFVDRTFNCNREHTRRIWTYIKEHDNGITNFHFEIAADILTEEEIALLHTLRPGLVQLEIGVQSTNVQTIQEIHRVMDVKKLAEIVENIRQGHNVHQHLDLIVGLPHENYESFTRSFDRVYAMKPDQLQMGFLKMLKGSYMHEHGKEYGIVYTDHAPYEVLYTNWISYEEVRRLKRIEEMVERYYNSNQFVHTLPFLISYFKGPFDFFETLADFYEREGFFINTPSRMYRYEVLLNFGKEHLPLASVEILRELLTYDIYLRENMKSRPAFALDISEEMKTFRKNFYREEETTHAYLPELVGLDQRQLSRQTHMEWFRYPVWEEKFTTSSNKNSTYCVLFNYQKRNPLNMDAETIWVETVPLHEKVYTVVDVSLNTGDGLDI